MNTTLSVTDVNITKLSDYSVSGGGELFSFQNSAFSYEKCTSIFHPRLGKLDSSFVFDIQIDVSVSLSVHTI
ncbi:hypothetical protein DXB79_09530 [Bacteroides fragilis]|nr:hypothetical protein F9003_00420 [Bacteroides fragilis]RGM83996.1 hypothetical protein DXB89_17125 [Bacteroides fragilis]RGN15639.1 hypothetical protein DXB79_09530 [Bacteroides fragilis]TWV55363.1 hypothetical protein FSA01_00420 [Bacteroides fragilis]